MRIRVGPAKRMSSAAISTMCIGVKKTRYSLRVLSATANSPAQRLDFLEEALVLLGEGAVALLALLHVPHMVFQLLPTGGLRVHAVLGAKGADLLVRHALRPQHRPDLLVELCDQGL